MNGQSSIQNLFLEIKSAGFFKRLFGWRSVVETSDAAEREWAGQQRSYDELMHAGNEAQARISSLIERQNEMKQNFSERAAEEERRYHELAVRGEGLTAELTQAREMLAAVSADKNAAVTRIAELEAATARFSEENVSVRAALTTENVSRRQTEEQYAGLKASFDELTATERRLREELAVAAGRGTVAAEQAAALSASLDTITAELNQAREALASEGEGRRLEEEKYAALKEESDTTASLLRELRDQFAVESEQKRAAVERAKNLTAEYEAVSREMQEVRSALSSETEGRRIEAKKYTDLKVEADEIQADLSRVKEQLAAEESVKAERAAEYERRVENLNTLVRQMESDHQKAAEKLKNEFAEHEQHLATSWQRHETEVAESLKSMAKKYDCVWCEKGEYPNPGTPDNVFLIGGMYTIFDAKSPKNPEELSNFPQYLKAQAEGMKKYCKHDNVRKEAFLVVPVSTLDALTTFMYDLAEYKVYIITPEAVLPIVQVLKMIEGYEFAEQLSPEDRDKLCRFIGKLSHTTKRKVQIDTYFSREFVQVLREIDTLPDEFAKEVEGYEQKAKLNPPMEKRAKMIPVADIESDVCRVENEILGWSVMNQ